MIKEAQTIHPGDKPTNGSAKFALEKRNWVNGVVDRVDVFLTEAQVRDPVRFTQVSGDGNGHRYSAVWRGRKIEIGEQLSIDSAIIAKGTGCLVIIEGDKQTTIFMEAGKIVREEVAINGVPQEESETQKNIQGRFEL